MRYSQCGLFFTDLFYFVAYVQTIRIVFIYLWKNNSFIFMGSLPIFMLGFLLLCKSRSNTFQLGDSDSDSASASALASFSDSDSGSLCRLWGLPSRIACRFKNTFICMIWQFFKAIDLPQLIKTGRKKNIMARCVRGVRCVRCVRCYLANIWNCLKNY